MVREKLKGFSKDVAIYGIGDALGRMIGLIMLPILSRIFGPADYGAIDLLTVGYAFALMLLRLGIPTGIQRHYFKSEGLERRRMVTSCLTYLMILDGLGATAVFLAAEPIARLIGGPPEGVIRSVQILAVAIVVEQIWSGLLLLLRLNRRSVAFSMANVALVVLNPTLVFVFVVTLDMGMSGVFSAKLASLGIVTAGLFFVTRNEFTPSADWSVFRRVFIFAIPGHPALMVTSVLNVAPRYLLAAFAPLAEVGLLGIAMRLSSVMRIAMEAFNRAWNPFAYANEGAEDEARVYEIVLKGITSATLVLVAALAVFSPEVLTILTPEAYHSAWRLVPWIVASLGFDGIVRVFSTILYTRNRVIWSTWLGLGRLVVFLALGFALVPHYRGLGLAWTLAATAALHAITYAFVALRVFAFPVRGGRLALAVGMTVVGIIAVLGVDLDLGPRLALKTVLIAVLAAGNVGLLLSREEIARVRRLAARRP